MLVRKNNFFPRVYLFFISIYLTLGNLGKIGVNINLIELFVLFLGVVGFAYIKINKSNIMVLFLLIFIIISSLVIGVVKSDFDYEAITYNLRLIAQVITVFTVSYQLLELEGSYGFDFIINNFINLYFFISMTSLIIFIIFPDSRDLWNFLSKFHIIIDGDPHIMRVVSTYFDPNFFGNILLFPLLLCFISCISYPNKKNVLKLIVMVLSLLLTFSRSSIVAFVFFVLCFYLYFLFYSFYFKKISKSLIIMIVLMPIIVILVLFNSYVSERIIGRFSNTSVNDGSTFARIESFNIGNYLFWKEPFLGYGYNFSINLQKQLRGGGIALDSSLQTILVSFGFIGSTFLGLIIVAFIYSLYQKYKKQDNQQRKMIYSCYILYLIVSILFMSIFNQLMLYPFWLIPIVSFGIYLLIRK